MLNVHLNEKEATSDMSKDLSEGDVSPRGQSNRGRLPRINSVDAMETWATQQKGKELYIVLNTTQPPKCLALLSPQGMTQEFNNRPSIRKMAQARSFLKQATAFILATVNSLKLPRSIDP